MSLYDAVRIIRKNSKYEKIRAYAVIEKLKAKGLSTTEMVEALEILLKDENSEFDNSVYSRAKSILESDKEFQIEKDTGKHGENNTKNTSNYCSSGIRVPDNKSRSTAL